MTHPADIIMVFDRDDELSAFPSLRAAETWLEAINVEDGEYVAYTADGHVVDLLAPAARRARSSLREPTTRTGRILSAESLATGTGTPTGRLWGRRRPRACCWSAACVQHVAGCAGSPGSSGALEPRPDSLAPAGSDGHGARSDKISSPFLHKSRLGALSFAWSCRPPVGGTTTRLIAHSLALCSAASSPAAFLQAERLASVALPAPTEARYAIEDHQAEYRTQQHDGPHRSVPGLVQQRYRHP